MRVATSLFAALIFGTSFLVSCVMPLRAAEFGTREEAVAMVRRVQEKFKKEGAEATLRAINSAKSEFVDRDLFPYVHKLDGTRLVAAAANQSMLGMNMHDFKDQDGKFFVQEFVKVANAPPYHGWVDYRFFNPKTNSVEDKSAWIERMGDYLVGVGIYKNEQPNENTIGVISGSPNSDDTYLQMAFDLADVLNDGDNLRILPIAGIGGPRNIRDVRYLRGVDIGLTQTNILNSLRRSDQRMGQPDEKVAYIAKLFNEEVHLVAGPDITSIEQLQGRKVNLDAKGGGTSYSMRDLFKTFGIEVEEVSMSQVEALDKVKSGEIAATALIAGKPVRAVSEVSRRDGLHFVPVPYPAELINDYLPATLTHDDYPELLAPGETVDTVAVGAVMIAYNWPKTSADRYRRVERFVQAFFSKIAEFQKPPHHVKWREVNIAATLPNWPRFPAAEEWLDNQRQNQARSNPAQALPAVPVAGQVARPAAVQGQSPRPPSVSTGAAPFSGSPDEQKKQQADAPPTLFQQFMNWRQSLGR
ncbi:MAG: cache domain-containing protein [Bradyrhizobiaceae bacterium]|nr:cache domain-containing protein [Bradyrhizobiaceae bacterium]